MEFAWRRCPGCGTRFYGKREFCLTCRLALESGEVQIVRMDADEDDDAPTIVRAEDVLRRAEAAAGAEPEQEGGEPEVPHAEQTAEPALSSWPPPVEELAQVAAGRTAREIADLYGVSADRVRNMLYNHGIPYRRLRNRRRDQGATADRVEPRAVTAPAASFNGTLTMADLEGRIRQDEAVTDVPTSRSADPLEQVASALAASLWAARALGDVEIELRITIPKGA